jgi:3-phenylpropionate/trans-cinnamate dioxygenase ferredoxin reductase component
MAADGLIIIGASLAGAKAAEGARARGWEGPIRLVGEEPLLPYERPPLSKKVLIGADQPSAALVHDPSFYVTNEIDLLLGARADAIDLGAHRVELAGGRQLRFDKLVLATGSSVRRLSIEGAELPEVQYLRTMADTLALRDELLSGRRVAVIGASWIGTEVAACARQRGCDVAMIDPTPTPLERVLGAEVGTYFARLHTAHGVQLHMGIGVDGIEGTEHVKGVRLSDGRTVDADLVVVGVGVTPNIDLARDAGLAVGKGVLVDQTLATSHDDVLAAGDIAEAEHPLSSERVRVEHWANALNQGLTAGANAAGGHETYDRIPYFYSDQYDDMSMEHSGWPTPFDRVVFRGDPNDGAFVAFYLRGDRVIAGANVNVWDVNQHVQALIRANQPANVTVLTDPDVDPANWAAASR